MRIPRVCLLALCILALFIGCSPVETPKTDFPKETPKTVYQPDRAEIEKLIKGLETDKAEACNANVEKLALIGEGAVEPLISALKYNVKHFKTDYNNVQIPLSEAEKNFHQGVRAALVKIGAPSVQPVIKELMGKYPFDSEDFAWILGEIGDKRALPVLREAVKYTSKDPFGFDSYICKGEATRALVKISGPAEVPNFVKELRNKDSDYDHDSIIGGFIGIGEPAVPFLAKVLEDKSEGAVFRNKVIGVFTAIRDKKTAPLFIKMLEDEKEDPTLRWNAAVVLGNIGGEEFVPPLINALENGVYGGALYALGKIGDRRAVPALLKLLDEEVEKNGAKANLDKRDIIDALGKIGDSRAVYPLIRRLNDIAWCDNASEALVAIGEPAVQPLTSSLDSQKGSFIRDKIRETLKKIEKKQQIKKEENSEKGTF